MAHTCIECGSYCTCHGDIDDIDFGEVEFCTHCPVDGGDEESFFSGTDNIFCSKCGCDSFESPIHFVNNSWLCKNCTSTCACKLPGLSANDPTICPTCGKPHRNEVTK